MTKVTTSKEIVKMILQQNICAIQFLHKKNSVLLHASIFDILKKNQNSQSQDFGTLSHLHKVTHMLL